VYGVGQSQNSASSDGLMGIGAKSDHPLTSTTKPMDTPLTGRRSTRRLVLKYSANHKRRGGVAVATTRKYVAYGATDDIVIFSHFRFQLGFHGRLDIPS
jgi:hypothetical protein